LLIWFVITFLAPGPFVFALNHALRRGGNTFTVQSELPTKAILAFFVVLATWVVSQMEKRPLDDYGIPPSQAFKSQFWEGSVWGFVMLSGVLFILHVLGHFRIDCIALSGGAGIRYAFGWAAVFLAVSVSEEFAFRGYWLFSTSKRFRFWPSAVFLSLLFVVGHIFNPGENALGLTQVFIVSLFFCLTIRRTGNLWFALGFHAAWDWAQTFFYGTLDSGVLGVGRLLNTFTQGPNWLTGGSAGPEGSVVTLVGLLFCALMIHFRFPKVNYPDRPD